MVRVLSKQPTGNPQGFVTINVLTTVNGSTTDTVPARRFINPSLSGPTGTSNATMRIKEVSTLAELQARIKAELPELNFDFTPGAGAGKFDIYRQTMENIVHKPPRAHNAKNFSACVRDAVMLAGHNQTRLRNSGTDILTYAVLRRDDAAAAAGAGGVGGVVGRAVSIDQQMSSQAMQLASESNLSLRGANNGTGQGDQFAVVLRRRFKMPSVAANAEA